MESMENQKEVVIVIPIYKSKPENVEWSSIKQTFRVLGEYTIAFVHPLELDVEVYKSFGGNSIFQPFSDKYFLGIEGYNSLLLSQEFYERFTDYQFMLICQPDAWVFRNEISLWIQQSYDYMGAPWISEVKGDEIVYDIPSGGNGGFSLRNISVFLKVLRSRIRWYTPGECWNEIRKFHGLPGSLLRIPVWVAMIMGYRNNVRWFVLTFGRNEDVFWSVYALKFLHSFKAAPGIEEINFAWEKCAPELFKLQGKLPMGCHAWEKWYPEFWKKHIYIHD
jgi:hypothetical protein